MLRMWELLFKLVLLIQIEQLEVVWLHAKEQGKWGEMVQL